MQTSSVLAGTWIWPISGSSSEGEPVPFQPEASMSERRHGEEPGYIGMIIMYQVFQKL
jgi:hypothetical protein